MDNKESIVVVGALEILNFLCNSSRDKCIIQFYHRTTCTETLINEYRSIFDQIEYYKPK